MTDKERKAIAEIFRKIKPNSPLSLVEAQPAVKYLVRLKGFSKVEDDVLHFFEHHFDWFCDKRKVFAKASDDEVLRQVRNLFRAYKGYQEKKEKVEEAKRVLSLSYLTNKRGERIPEDKIHCTKLKTFDKTQYAVDRERTEAKKELKFLRWLSTGWRAKDAVYQMMFRRQISRLKRIVDHQDDPDAKAEDLWRASDEVMKAIKEALQKKRTPKK